MRGAKNLCVFVTVESILQILWRTKALKFSLVISRFSIKLIITQGNFSSI
jgi:hypothetical protein